MSTLWFNFCLGTWGWLAQVAPTITPAATAPATTPASGTPSAVPNLNAPPPVEAHSGVPAVIGSLLHGVALFGYFVICVALIVCVMFQTTKSEGLSGMIGGSSSSALFRGKKSAEETLGLWTGRLAVAFIASSLVIWLIFGRGGT